MRRTILDDTVLKSKIRTLITDHSGGMKFTELVTYLTEWVCINKYIIESGFPDYAFYVISKMKDLKVLEYTHKPLRRAKFFVYTP
jgi:hypothetical protein